MININERKGRFLLPSFTNESANLFYAKYKCVFSNCIITRCELLSHTDRYEYYAISQLFEPVGKNTLIPTYEALVLDLSVYEFDFGGFLKVENNR